MLRLFATASLAALVLAACAPKVVVPKGDEVEAMPAENVTAEPESEVEEGPRDTELSYTHETDLFSVSAEIDPAIRDFDPDLAQRLWTASRKSLDELAAQAQADHISAQAYEGETGQTSWFMPYSLDIKHEASVVLDEVISITGTTGIFTGGAHPNYFLGGAIYRKGETEPVPAVELVADQAAFSDLVVSALADVKIARGIEARDRADIEAGLREQLAPSADYADVYEGRLALVPSTVAGKAGGIKVVFSPYDVGSYAEGSYEVVLPAEGLTTILSPNWTSMFGGAPAVAD